VQIEQEEKVREAVRQSEQSAASDCHDHALVACQSAYAVCYICVGWPECLDVQAQLLQLKRFLAAAGCARAAWICCGIPCSADAAAFFNNSQEHVWLDGDLLPQRCCWCITPHPNLLPVSPNPTKSSSACKCNCDLQEHMGLDGDLLHPALLQMLHIISHGFYI
jgi:hypothetical protein